MTKRNQPRKQRVKNTIARQRSGQGSQYDFGTEQTPQAVWMSPLQQDQFAVTLYETDWAAKKIVKIPVDDMLRDGWRVTGIDEEQVGLMDLAQGQLSMLEVFRQAMRLERLVGGGAIYLGVSDGETDPAVPLNRKNLGRGSLKFLNALPRSRVASVEWNLNPLSENYGRPEHFIINGQRVHRSRLVLFKGDPLLPVPDGTIASSAWTRTDGFGQSVLIAIWDDLARATGSRQAAYQMVQRASVFLAGMDLEALEGTKQGQVAIEAMKSIVNQINVYRGAVYDKQPGETAPPITTLATQFGSVPELVMSFLQVLSAASDIPATRFLGQAPGGLNATGESDLENYYGRLESQRTQDLLPKLLPVVQLVAISTFGSLPPGLGVEFDPLWSLSEVEEADVRSKNIDNVVKLTDAGMLTPEEGLDELQKRDAIMVTPSGDDLGTGQAVDEPPAAQSLSDSIGQMLQ